MTTLASAVPEIFQVVCLVFEMTYYVSSGTLNLTHSLTQAVWNSKMPDVTLITPT